MLQKFTLELDAKTYDLAKHYSDKTGKSFNALFEMFLRFMAFNEDIYAFSNLDLTTGSKTTIQEKETDWDELDELINPFRKGLPEDYKFDRELAHER